MKTLKLTAKHFKKSSSYWSDYIGKEDVSDYDGHIEIEGGLGYVRFEKLKVKGSIVAQAGTGIKAGWGIEAGWGIKAGDGITAGLGIKAGDGIEAGGGIKAGWGITAGDGIEARDGIEAGWGIKAGDGITAGWGIKAGLGIECKLTLSIGLRIFAGLCLWRQPTEDELLIECGKLEKGEVCYGTLKELGMPNEEKEEESLSGKTVTVTLDGKTYEAVIK